MAKRLKLGGFNGYDYFGKLPDEVVITIFTKLSSSSGNNTLEDDIKSLVQCSAVSKRFNALNSLVPTLFISHPSVNMLNECCPQILNKFKHISSLCVNHLSSVEAPFILWDAVREPDIYCLVVVSCTHVAKYVRKNTNLQQQPSSMHVKVANNVMEKVRVSTRDETEDMFTFHHMLVSSISEHKLLERVVVANSQNPEIGNLTLEGDILVKLKNCTSPSLEHVRFRDRSDSAGILDIPLTQNKGYVMSNTYFNIIEWWGNAPDKINWDDNDDDIDEDHSFPEALHLKGCKKTLLKEVLKRILAPAYTIMTVNHKLTNDLLLDIK